MRARRLERRTAPAWDQRLRIGDVLDGFRDAGWDFRSAVNDPCPGACGGHRERERWLVVLRPRPPGEGEGEQQRTGRRERHPRDEDNRDVERRGPRGERRGRRREARTARGNGPPEAAGPRPSADGESRQAPMAGCRMRAARPAPRLPAGAATTGVSFGSDVVSGARVCRGFGVGLAAPWRRLGVGFGVGSDRRLGVWSAWVWGFGFGVGLGVGLGVGFGVDGTLIVSAAGALPGEDHPCIRRGQTGRELIRPRPRRADLALPRVSDRRDTGGRRRLAG